MVESTAYVQICEDPAVGRFFLSDALGLRMDPGYDPARSLALWENADGVFRSETERIRMAIGKVSEYMRAGWASDGSRVPAPELLWWLERACALGFDATNVSLFLGVDRATGTDLVAEARVLGPYVDIACWQCEDVVGRVPVGVGSELMRMDTGRVRSFVDAVRSFRLSASDAANAARWLRTEGVRLPADRRPAMSGAATSVVGSLADAGRSEELRWLVASSAFLHAEMSRRPLERAVSFGSLARWLLRVRNLGITDPEAARLTGMNRETLRGYRRTSHRLDPLVLGLTNWGGGGRGHQGRRSPMFVPVSSAAAMSALDAAGQFAAALAVVEGSLTSDDMHAVVSCADTPDFCLSERLEYARLVRDWRYAGHIAFGDSADAARRVLASLSYGALSVWPLSPVP